jgi:hypothetical protein
MKTALALIVRRFVVALALVFGLGIAGAACPGCPTPPTVTGVLNCTGPAVQQYGIPLIPKVNNCLTGTVDWMGCLISLLSPAAGITEEVLACVTRDQGGKFAQTADDPLESQAACRADAFITEKKYEFQDGYQRPEGLNTDICKK